MKITRLATLQEPDQQKIDIEIHKEEAQFKFRIYTNHKDRREISIANDSYYSGDHNSQEAAEAAAMAYIEERKKEGLKEIKLYKS